MYFAIRVYDDKDRQNKSRDLEMLHQSEPGLVSIGLSETDSVASIYSTEEIIANVSIWKPNRILDMRGWVIIYSSFYYS